GPSRGRSRRSPPNCSRASHRLGGLLRGLLAEPPTEAPALRAGLEQRQLPPAAIRPGPRHDVTDRRRDPEHAIAPTLKEARAIGGVAARLLVVAGAPKRGELLLERRDLLDPLGRTLGKQAQLILVGEDAREAADPI